ncbi:MAG: TOBE domain-containing protein [Bacteroidota bacterium]
MNRFKGIIKEIETSGSLSLVKVDVQDTLFSTIIIDTPETLTSLQLGHSVDVIFKESEVALGKEPFQISLQNRVPGNIKKIERNELLSKVELNTAIGMITALITTKAVLDLGLLDGEDATALIKTNEIMLSYD